MAAKKTILTIAMIAVFLVMAALGGQPSPASAQTGVATVTAAATQTGDDFPVFITVTGVIKTVVQQSSSVLRLELEDGTEILVNPATQGSTQYKVGQTVEIMGSFEDELLVAKTSKVTLTPTATAGATQQPTLLPTLQPTLAPTQAGTPAATGEASCGSGNTHPVANKLADAFGVPYSEIMGWHCKGFGFGEIARAYLLAQNGKLTADELFDKRKSGEGWGNLIKEVGGKAKDLAPGAVISGKKNPLATPGATSAATSSGAKSNIGGKSNSGNSDKSDNSGKGNSNKDDNSSNSLANDASGKNNGNAGNSNAGGNDNSNKGGGNDNSNKGGNGNDKGGGKGK